MKIIIASLLIFFACFVNAQSFVLTPHTNPISGDNWNELTTDISIENISSVTKNVKVRKFIIDTIPGSENYFCLINCFLPSTYISPNPMTSPGLSVNDSSFSVHLTPNGVEGLSKVKYCLYDVNNLSDSACVTITYSHYAISNISPVNSEFLCKIYPNPSDNGVINFNYYLPNNLLAKLMVLDVLGNIVYVSNLNVGTQNIILSDLQKGIYFAKIIINGKAEESHKIVISY